MRTWTDAEEHAYDGTPAVRVRVEIADSTDTLRDWTDIDGLGTGLIKSISWGDTLEQPMAAGEATIVWRLSEHDNLSPFVTGGRYDGYLAAWRRIVISIKAFPPGADESAFAWREVFRGRIDDFDLSQNPGKIQFRDAVGAELMDQFITANTRYGSDGGLKDIEDVIADIFTDFDKVAGGHPLVTPVATTLQVASYNQQKMPLLQAAQNLAVAIGWDIRAKWNDDAGAWRLTLYEPDRTGSTPDHVIPAADIKSFGSFSFAVQHVRNVVRVFYGDTTQTDELLGNDLRSSVVRTATTSPTNSLAGTAVAASSIAKYGWRYMELAEGATSLVQGTSQAQALADFALSDLADPTLLMGVGLAYLFWPVELNDLYTFEADAIRFGSNSNLAIHGYRHVIDEMGHRTELTLQGKPGIGATRWTNREARPGKHAPADDLGPRTPTVSVSQTPLGATIEVGLPRDFDLDQILFYESRQKVFTPSSRTLKQAGRQKSYTRVFSSPTDRVWVMAKARDIHGNYSAAAGPIALTPSKLDGGFFSPTLQAKTSLRFAADTAISVSGAVAFQRYATGGSFGLYDVATGRMEAPEDGVYRFAMSGTLATSMTVGTDYALALLRDPDGDAEEIARAIVQPVPSGSDQVYSLEDFVALDAGDVVEIEVLDLGASPFTTVTFRATTSHLLIEKTVGTESRSNRAPIVQPDPGFVDHGMSSVFSIEGQTCAGAALLSTGEVLFTEGVGGGGAYPASIVAASQNTRRNFEISGSTDYFYTRAVEHPTNRQVYVGAHKVDVTALNGVRAYTSVGNEAWATADFGASIVVRGLAYANGSVFAATSEGAAGKVRRIVATSGAISKTSDDLGGPCRGCAVIGTSIGQSTVVTVNLTTSTVKGLAAFDVSIPWVAAWSLDISALATHAGAATAGSDVVATPDASRAYVSAGPSNPHLYCVDAQGVVLWSVDCGNDSTMTDVTGVICIAVHPATGDLYALVRYTDVDAADHLDLLVYDPTGVFRWSFRELDDLDPADDPAWTTSTTHFMTVGADGAVWISDGSVSRYKKFTPFEAAPAQPPVFKRSDTISKILADIDPARLQYENGSAIPTAPAKLGTLELRLQQSTTAEQPSFVAGGEAEAVGGVKRTLTDFPALTFDGTKDINSSSDAVDLSAGFAFVLVAEPTDATRNYFSLYPDAGSAAAPAVELYVDGDGNLRLATNEDVAGETYVRRPALAGAQVIAGRLGTTAALWFSNDRPNRTEAFSGSNPTPDTAGRFRLGRSSGTSGVDWFEGWTYRLLLLDDDANTVSRVCSLVHWARAYYGVSEVAQPAAEAAPEFGTTITSIGRTQYFTEGSKVITSMDATGLSGKCAIMRQQGSSSSPHAKLIPDDAGATIWTMATTHMQASGGVSGGLSTSADYVFVHLDGEDGTLAAAGRPMVARLAVADGTQDWASSVGAGFNPTGRRVSTYVAEYNKYFAGVNDSSDELWMFNGGTGASEGDTAISSAIGGPDTFESLGVTNDESFLLAAGNFSEKLCGTALPFTSGQSWSFTLNMKNGTASTLTWSAWSNANVPPAIRRDRVGNGAWMCGGLQAGTFDEPWLMHIEPGGGSASVDIEIDVGADMAITRSTSNHVTDCAVDKHGHVYALVTNAAGNGDVDVVRYDQTGTKVISFKTQGATLPVAADSTIAFSIAVDENGTVYIGDEDGFVWVYTQS